MKFVVNRTPRKYNNENQITNVSYEQKSMSILKTIITKLNSHQIKLKQNKLPIMHKKRYGTFPKCDWVTGRQKERQIPCLEAINFKVVETIRQ